VLRLYADEHHVVLRLNPLEKFMDLSIRNFKVPLSAIQSVEVAAAPHGDVLDGEANFGFAGNTAPTRKVMTLGTRAKTKGGRAAVAEYFNRPAVMVRLAPNPTPWRFLVASSKHPDRLATSILRAAHSQRWSTEIAADCARFRRRAATRRSHRRSRQPLYETWHH